MMKLHAQLYIYECFVFLLKIGGVWCCWWIVDEFIFNWCCCCYEMLLMIETLGNHNHRVVVWNCLVLKVLQKWIKWWFVMEWCFGSSFIWIWVFFYVFKRLDKHWEKICALGIQNWDFGVKTEFYPRANCHSSSWRANWWPRRVMKCPARHGEWFGGHGELLNITTHVFGRFGGRSEFSKMLLSICFWSFSNVCGSYYIYHIHHLLNEFKKWKMAKLHFWSLNIFR